MQNATPLTVKLDKINPTLTWTGGPANGSSHYFGSVPAAPTCTAVDPLYSGPNGCTVIGYSNLVGSHTMTATALDLAGNSYSETRTYTVLAWTLNGFYQPVDMNGVVNTVKNGSTVPLKFEVFAGSTELTDPSIVNQPLTATQSLCSGGTTDDIELLATGVDQPALRLDRRSVHLQLADAEEAGLLLLVTVTTADGSSISANFKLK